MTANDPRQTAPGARPVGGKQQQAAAIREPQDQTGSTPKFVIEVWASPRLHDQNPRRALSLEEALGRGPAPHREPEPDPQPEPGP
jgi:hypothetical protein